MRRVLLLLVLAACEKNDPLFCQENPGASGCPIADGNGSAVIDAMVDGDPGIDARMCFGTGNYEVCLASLPSGGETLSGTLDTGTSTKCLATQPAGWTTRGQPESCFVVGTTVTITGVDVTGTRPLVILATNSITVSGTLDVASRVTGTAKRGPGAPFGGCAAALAMPTVSTNGGGGGAGGTFMTRGAAGGAGNNGQMGNTGGIAGNPVTQNPVALRAGCNGQSGGDGSAPGGVGGLGGGAVYLVAGNTITITNTGIINASGAGASGAGSHAGAGGGGSGGMIVLAASTISATNGKVLANGGGGGAGTNNGNGMAGNDPVATTPLTAAASVSGPANCCTGGSGFAQGSPAVAGVDGGQTLSGGGGGGGAGFIQATAALGTQVSPTPQ